MAQQHTGLELRVVRLQLGYTQAELAARIDMSTRMLNKYEAGQAVIPTVVWMAVQLLSFEPRRKVRT